MRDIVFKEAKKYLRFVRMSGPNNLGGPCPFHKSGQERHPSFYINLENGLYFCHSCKASGTFVQFLKRMGTPVPYIEHIMEETENAAPPRRRVDPYRNAGFGEHFLNEGILGVFQYCPTDLVNAGFDQAVLQQLEIGFDRELMRIVFPIRDLRGRLVGLSGRDVTGASTRYDVYTSNDLMRYAGDDPDTRARYMRYEIKNHNFIWNAHNVYPQVFFGDLDTIVVVEGYKACIWMIQNGIENTVALQGSYLTQAQERIFHRISGNVILFLDNDKAGREGTANIGRRLRRVGLRVLCVKYPEWVDDRAQPDSLDKPELLGVLDAAQDWHPWRIK